MKKITKILAAAAVLACGLILSGCAAAETIKETVVENVNGSYKQWYKYKKGDKQVDIPVVAKAADDTENATESSNKLKNVDIYFYFDPDVGLKIAIQSTTTQEVEMLKGLYKTQMDVVMGSTKDYSLATFGKKSWYTLWGSGKIEKTSAPKIVTNPDECIVLGKDNETPAIQWKKVLANYLLDSLLEE